MECLLLFNSQLQLSSIGIQANNSIMNQWRTG